MAQIFDLSVDAFKKSIQELETLFYLSQVVQATPKGPYNTFLHTNGALAWNCETTFTAQQISSIAWQIRISHLIQTLSIQALELVANPLIFPRVPPLNTLIYPHNRYGIFVAVLNLLELCPKISHLFFKFLTILGFLHWWVQLTQPLKLLDWDK